MPCKESQDFCQSALMGSRREWRKNFTPTPMTHVSIFEQKQFPSFQRNEDHILRKAQSVALKTEFEFRFLNCMKFTALSKFRLDVHRSFHAVKKEICPVVHKQNACLVGFREGCHRNHRGHDLRLAGRSPVQGRPPKTTRPYYARDTLAWAAPKPPGWC